MLVVIEIFKILEQGYLWYLIIYQRIINNKKEIEQDN